MNFITLLLNLILVPVLVLGENNSMEGSGFIDLIEGSGSSEVVINLSDYEINESAMSGRSDLEDLPKAEKFIGPQYIISRKDEMDSETFISEFLPNIILFPESKSNPQFCSCECSNQYQYEHYQHDSNTNVNIVLQDDVLGDICNEEQLSICCESSVISTTGQPRFLALC